MWHNLCSGLSVVHIKKNAEAKLKTNVPWRSKYFDSATNFVHHKKNVGLSIQNKG